jgi:hypothetical protein
MSVRAQGGKLRVPLARSRRVPGPRRCRRPPLTSAEYVIACENIHESSSAALPRLPLAPFLTGATGSGASSGAGGGASSSTLPLLASCSSARKWRHTSYGSGAREPTTVAKSTFVGGDAGDTVDAAAPSSSMAEGADDTGVGAALSRIAPSRREPYARMSNSGRASSSASTAHDRGAGTGE